MKGGHRFWKPMNWFIGKPKFKGSKMYLNKFFKYIILINSFDVLVIYFSFYSFINVMHGHTIISYLISLYGTINLTIFFATFWGVKLLLIYNKNDVNCMVLKTRLVKEPKKRPIPGLTRFLTGVFWFFVSFDRTISRFGLGFNRLNQLVLFNF